MYSIVVESLTLILVKSMNKSCKNCEGGYVKKNGLYLPCADCITPARFEQILKTAISGCKGDSERLKALKRIQSNLPDYPVMALLEAEYYGRFKGNFTDMLIKAYKIRPFQDVKYNTTNI